MVIDAKKLSSTNDIVSLLLEHPLQCLFLNKTKDSGFIEGYNEADIKENLFSVMVEQGKNCFLPKTGLFRQEETIEKSFFMLECKSKEGIEKAEIIAFPVLWSDDSVLDAKERKQVLKNRREAVKELYYRWRGVFSDSDKNNINADEAFHTYFEEQGKWETVDFVIFLKKYKNKKYFAGRSKK